MTGVTNFPFGFIAGNNPILSVESYYTGVEFYYRYVKAVAGRKEGGHFSVRTSER